MPVASSDTAEETDNDSVQAKELFPAADETATNESDSKVVVEEQVAISEDNDADVQPVDQTEQATEQSPVLSAETVATASLDTTEATPDVHKGSSSVTEPGETKASSPETVVSAEAVVSTAKTTSATETTETNPPTTDCTISSEWLQVARESLQQLCTNSLSPGTLREQYASHSHVSL